MKHSLLKILLCTLLLVLVNSIQSCGGNIDFKKPTSIAPKEEKTPANKPTPNNTKQTTSPNPQESEGYANDTAQQQELKNLQDNLLPDVRTNIDNYLKKGPQEPAISSLQNAIKLLEEGNMNYSQLKIFEEAANMGVESYLKDFNANDTSKSLSRIDKFYVKKGKSNEQLVKMRVCISNTDKRIVFDA